MRSILTIALLAAVTTAAGYAQSKPYKATEEGVKAPAILKEVKPKYTAGAMERKVQGSVEVDAVVLADGNVGDVTVTKSLDPELDEQAVNATKQWKFRPGTKDGKAVAVQVQIELTFTLRSQK